nr:gamma-parvin isoform X2 [Saimiri boliviensis boliviensis]
MPSELWISNNQEIPSEFMPQNRNAAVSEDELVPVRRGLPGWQWQDRCPGAEVLRSVGDLQGVWPSAPQGPHVLVIPTLLPGGKKKYLPPTSRKDPRFEELQKVLMEWINATLLPEHIVVRSLEEDVFDGLILHHLFQKLAALKLEAEDIALTAASQRHKLTVVLEAVNRSLQLEDRQPKWSVETIFNKDLLSTLHLLVALAKRFQPDLSLPANVQVEVITIESTKSGLKSEKSMEQLTECSTDKDQPPKDVFDELFKLAPEKVNAVKEAIVNFVNQKLDRLGLSVQNLDTQLHNVTLALELLKEEGLLSCPVSPEDIVNKDAKSTLRVLYGLFCKHRQQAHRGTTPQGAPN